VTVLAAEPIHTDDRLARRNALVLALAQALAGANASVIVATSGIVGSVLAPDQALATLPISVYVLGLWQGALPVGALARRFGRRTAFQIGSVFGILTGLFCCLGVLQGSFLIFNIGTFCGGIYGAAHNAYRFAAADTASEAFRPKAISWVLAGGIAAGVIGPQLVIFTKDLWQPYLFAATYIGQATVAALAMCILVFVRIPRFTLSGSGRSGRPLTEILRQPRFVVAVACGVASYAMMNMVMTSAPLAMHLCGHSITDAALGIQWHVLGMFAPSFITGSLIARFGADRITVIGLALIAVSAAISITGLSVMHFWIGLTVLGIGWNFAFVGATTMVTQCHRPEERTTVQSFNDFLVFGSMAIGSFASGSVLARYGWAMVNEIVFPVILVAAVLLVWGNARAKMQAV
jgi:predicted MFS family arabinose efflux permease